MFLTQFKAKGNQYIYLTTKTPHPEHRKNKRLFSFGQTTSAIQKMQEWQQNFNLFPEELIILGCNKSDLDIWITTMITGVTKTGRKFDIKK